MLQSSTYDETYAGIAAHHTLRQRAAGFLVERRIDDGYGSYEITDHHAEL